jgi:cytochrome c-type biogenesis protein CcmH/NrfF
VTLFEHGKQIGELTPAKWFFNQHENEPISQVAIRRSAAGDFYLVLAGYDAQQQSATYAITLNPLVNWIWFGFGVLAFGTGIALLPERAFTFALAKVPAGAVTTGLMLLLLLLPSPARAQTSDTGNIRPTAVEAIRTRVRNDVMCTCGCRAPMATCPMAATCAELHQQDPMLDQWLGQGMTHDEILAAFVKWRGSPDILMAPPDRGFNRLAWLLPYLIGGSGAVAVAFVAVRWSRRPPALDAAAKAASQEDPALGARLDDELRDLD